jgi:hypothetical protein
MLFKNICKMCISIELGDEWREADNFRWDINKEVCCPSGCVISINQTPPVECKYRYIHNVESNRNKEWNI